MIVANESNSMNELAVSGAQEQHPGEATSPQRSCSSANPPQQQGGVNKSCPPPHYQVLGAGADPESISMFYMTVYKVALCPKPYSHDWGACPYAHEKENARRRDPLKFQYSSCICPNSGKGGECPNGLACQYSHTLFEYWLHPMRYRTQMCRSGANCSRSLCFFAHSQAELRAPCQPVVLLEQQRQKQQVVVTPTGYGALTAVAASSAGLRPAVNGLAVQIRSDVSGWPLVAEQGSGQGGIANQRSMLLGAGQAQLGTVTGPVYTLGSTGDMSSCSNASSSGAVLLVPGQTTMLTIPAQQAQAVLKPSEYLLLQQQQQLPQQQHLQLYGNQYDNLQLRLQQQPVNVSTVTQVAGLPTATLQGNYISVPVPEVVAGPAHYVASNNFIVQQNTQNYSLPMLAADSLLTVSGGMCIMPTGI